MRPQVKLYEGARGHANHFAMYAFSYIVRTLLGHIAFKVHKKHTFDMRGPMSFTVGDSPPSKIFGSASNDTSRKDQ